MIKVTYNRRDLEKIDKAMGKLDMAIVATNVQLFNDCVEGNPVDTGFSRASWWVAPGAQPTVTKGQGASGAPVAAPSLSDAPTLLSSAGKRIIVANGASYIRDLEYKGTSPQNVGWVRRAAARWGHNLTMNLQTMLGKG